MRPLIVLLLCFCSAVVGAEARIAAIRFEGNEVTRERVLRQELTVQVGDRVDPERIERSRQAIMDLGLFKSVRWSLEDAPEGKVLTYTVEEKYYVLPLPLVDADPDGSYSYGGEVRLDNLGGLNQRLKLKLDTSGDADGESSEKRELSLDYSYPRIGGSTYNLVLGAEVERREFDVTGDTADAHYQRDYRRLGVEVSRWITTFGPSRGWRIGGGVVLEQQDYSRLSGDRLYDDQQAVALIGSVLFDAQHDHGWYRSGGATGYQLALGLRELGSDEFFTRHLLFYRRYHAFGAGHNLNWRLQFGLANGTKFGGLAYSVGGDKTLRGYDSEGGNAMVLANVEYLRPLYKTLRGLLFADVGNVYPGVLETDLTDLRAGVGFGLRWDVAWFVDTTLRADMAYNLEDGETRTYVGTSRTF